MCVLLILVSCSHSRDRQASDTEALPYQVDVAERTGTVAPVDIARAKNLRPQLRKPFRLAIFLPEPESKHWDWNTRDKEEVRDIAEFLQNRRIVSQFAFLNTLTAAGSSPAEIRLAAARQGADALLVLKGRAKTTRSWNPLAFLYLTIVGYFVVPGTNIDALMTIESALFDVGNGYVYSTNEADGEGDTFGPGGVVREENALLRAKRRALETLAQEFLNSLETL